MRLTNKFLFPCARRCVRVGQYPHPYRRPLLPPLHPHRSRGCRHPHQAMGPLHPPHLRNRCPLRRRGQCCHRHRCLSRSRRPRRQSFSHLCLLRRSDLRNRHSWEGQTFPTPPRSRPARCCRVPLRKFFITPCPLRYVSKVSHPQISRQECLGQNLRPYLRWRGQAPHNPYNPHLDPPRVTRTTNPSSNFICG